MLSILLIISFVKLEKVCGLAPSATKLYVNRILTQTSLQCKNVKEKFKLFSGGSERNAGRPGSPGKMSL